MKLYFHFHLQSKPDKDRLHFQVHSTWSNCNWTLSETYLRCKLKPQLSSRNTAEMFKVLSNKVWPYLKIETQLHDFWLLVWSIKVICYFADYQHHLNCFQDLVLFSTQFCTKMFDFETVSLRLLGRSIRLIVNHLYFKIIGKKEDSILYSLRMDYLLDL